MAAAKRKTQKKTATVSKPQIALPAPATGWWEQMPKEHRIMYAAALTGVFSALALAGYIPVASHTALRPLSALFSAVFGWGAPLLLAGILYMCAAFIWEIVQRRKIIYTGQIIGAFALLVLLLIESAELPWAPYNSIVGRAGAALLQPIPAVSRHILLFGAILIDGILVYKITWSDIARFTKNLLRDPALRTHKPPTDADDIPIISHAPADIDAYKHAGAITGISIQAYSKNTPNSGYSAKAAHIRGITGAETAIEPSAAAETAYDAPAYLRRRVSDTESHNNEEYALPPLLPAKSGKLRRAGKGNTGEHAVPEAEKIEPQNTAQNWLLPSMQLFNQPPEARGVNMPEYIERLAGVLERTMRSFHVDVEVRRADISVGPSIIRFGVRPVERMKIDDQGRAVVDSRGDPVVSRTRVSRIMNLKNDLALALEAKSLRMEAPVPERPYVGVEIPNAFNRLVSLREILESREFHEMAPKSKLTIALGRDVAGKVRTVDLARFPHCLIAGATGSGKSVCLNAIICSVLSQAAPEDVRFILVDPKMVELTMYAGIPHLVTPVITDPKQVVAALETALAEMERRYKLFSQLNVRNLAGYSALQQEEHGADLERLPQIVIIIDELADLMMLAPEEVERSVCRLAQLARATGIHLVVATQRPSVDVITGLIKANIPTRIAFSVSSSVDSRTILDSGGAEHLLGKGDMLFLAGDAPRAERIQGVFVADEEAQRLADFWKNQQLRRNN